METGRKGRRSSGSILVMVMIVVTILLSTGIIIMMLHSTDSRIIHQDNQQQTGVSVIQVTGVTVEPDALSLAVLQTYILVATVYPVDATNRSVLWSSSDETVARVDGNGLVRAVGVGTALITAKTVDGNYEADCTVTVTEPLPFVIDPDGTITFITLSNKYMATDRFLVVPPNSDLSDINTNKHINWSAGLGMYVAVDLSLGGASSITFTSSNGDITVAVDVHLDPHKSFTVDAGGDVDLTGSKITAGDPIKIIAGGDIIADGVILTTSTGLADIELIAGGNIYVRSSYIDSKNGNVLLTTGSSEKTIHVSGATLKDWNNIAKARPVGVKIDGIPVFGQINYDG